MLLNDTFGITFRYESVENRKCYLFAMNIF